MTIQSNLLRAALLAALATGSIAPALVAPAQAQPAPFLPIDPKAKPDPLPVTIPADRIKPISGAPETPRLSLFDGWIHDVTLDARLGFSDTKSKVPDLPSKVHSRDVALGAEFRLLEQGFGQIGLSYARQEGRSRNTPANGSIAMDSDISVKGLQLTGGWFLLPFLGAGLNVGWGSTDGEYRFPAPTAPNQTDGGDRSIAPFITAVAPYDDWLFSLTGAVVYATQHQAYTDNTPPRQDGWSKSSALSFSASYQATRDIRLGGSLGWNHMLDQRSFDNETGLDENWYVLGLNGGYLLTPDLELVLSGTTWLGNEKTEFDRVSLGLRYRL